MPSEDSISREECVGKEKEFRISITRVHERVDTVEKTTASIETSAKIISDCVCRMEKIIFGDQHSDGLTTKVSNLNQKVRGAYWLGGVTISALIMSLVGTLIAFVFKK
jgi:hypothetical protein